MKNKLKVNAIISITLVLFLIFALFPISSNVLALTIKISVDQIGYYPNDPAKVAYIFGTTATTFLLKDTNNATVYSGNLSTRSDYNAVRIADFSSFITPGSYYINCDGANSLTFIIGDNLYDESFGKALRYFTYQREGDTTLNIEGTPTFIDDGKRSDNGQYIDVVGGWNDACDYRRWTVALGYGLMSLPTAYDRLDPDIDILNYNSIGKNSVSDLLDEAKWGATYFTKMIDTTTGMLYPYCGDDTYNYLTDGILGTADDRQVLVTRDPTDFQQKLFISYEACAGLSLIAKNYYTIDNTYANTLKDKALALWGYINSVEGPSDIVNTNTQLSFKIFGSINMYKMAMTFGLSQAQKDEYKARAISAATELLALQETVGATNGSITMRGFFYKKTGFGKTDADWNCYSGASEILALSYLYELFPTYGSASSWKTAVKMYINDFAKVFADINPYGYIPVDVVTTPQTYMTRQYGTSNFRYRYFADSTETTPFNWYIGNMGGQLSNAAALLYTADSSIMNGETVTIDNAKKMASRLLHITHGANPENKSFIRDVGQIQCGLYSFSGAGCPRPNLNIPGAVIAGNVGDANDNPTMTDDYQSLEH